MNAATVVAQLLALTTPVIRRRYFDPEWFVLFDGLSGQNPNDSLLGTASQKKFIKISKLAFGFGGVVINTLHYFLSVIYGLLYLNYFWSLEGAFLAFFWTTLFFLSFRGLSGRFICLPLYFYVFCLYASSRMAGIAAKIELISSRNYQELFRGRFSRLFQNPINNQEVVNKQVNSCNKLYRNVAALFIPTMGFCLMCLLLGFRERKKSPEERSWLTFS